MQTLNIHYLWFFLFKFNFKTEIEDQFSKNFNIMIQHTLILSTPKVEIPSTEILEFSKNLIGANLTIIDYFGPELDNGLDYIEDEMQNTIDNSTYLTFHFKQPEINYLILNNDEIINLLFNLLNNNEIGQVNADEKDIEIYIF